MSSLQCLISPPPPPFLPDLSAALHCAQQHANTGAVIGMGNTVWGGGGGSQLGSSGLRARGVRGHSVARCPELALLAANQSTWAAPDAKNPGRDAANQRSVLRGWSASNAWPTDYLLMLLLMNHQDLSNPVMRVFVQGLRYMDRELGRVSRLAALAANSAYFCHWWDIQRWPSVCLAMY